MSVGKESNVGRTRVKASKSHTQYHKSTTHTNHVVKTMPGHGQSININHANNQ